MERFDKYWWEYSALCVELIFKVGILFKFEIVHFAIKYRFAEKYIGTLEKECFEQNYIFQTHFSIKKYSVFTENNYSIRFPVEFIEWFDVPITWNS